MIGLLTDLLRAVLRRLKSFMIGIRRARLNAKIRVEHTLGVSLFLFRGDVDDESGFVGIFPDLMLGLVGLTDLFVVCE